MGATQGQRKTATGWRIFCCGMACAAMVWTAAHVDWRAPGKIAILTHSLAAGRSAKRMPVTMPSGSIAVDTATVDELCGLPGIGPALAEAIVAEREANGRFYFPEDLLNVRGIGQKKLAGFLDQMTLE